MSCRNVHRLIASSLIGALLVATTPALAGPAAATLTGTVYSNDVSTPLAGAKVVVTDVHGVKFESLPTGVDGAFTVAAIAPGRSAIALETKAGSFKVATPVTLAPGETRGVHLALKGASKLAPGQAAAGGAGWAAGEIAGMTVVILGFAAAGWYTYDRATEDTPTPASPYVPPAE